MLKLAHIAGFGVAALGCLVALWRARALSHTGTRVGLIGLLATTGVWATAQLVTFLSIPLSVATLAYEIGLVAGLASVGAWLYFCSAYTGQQYHRIPAYRYAALAAFVGISSVKLTNPLHGQYFTIEVVTTPFRYASVTLLDPHWAVAILAYSLSAVGFYMLFELFTQSNVPTTGLAGLVSLTAVPVALNLLSTLEVSWLVANNYEPLGVAAFAVGALYLAEDSFQQVRWASHRQLLDSINDAVIIVDADGIVREFNTTATDLFPGIAAGSDIQRVLPESNGGTETAIEEISARSGRLLTVERADQERYFLLKDQSLAIGPARTGRALVVSDITTVERQRRNLQRQSEALEGFSAAVAHELRNTLAIVSGNIDLMSEATRTDDPELTEELLERTSVTTERMTEIVDDLVTLARLGQPVSEPSFVEFRQTVRDAFSVVDADEMVLRIQGDGRIRADETRLNELIQNATRLAAETDSSELTAELTPDGFKLRMDGRSLGDDADALFEYGAAIPHSEAGMLGPNIRTLATAHDWAVSVTDVEPTGIEIVTTGVTVEYGGASESGPSA